MTTDYAYLQVAGYYLYEMAPVDGGTRYTYCKKNPPPYGPNNPSFEICDKLIIVRTNK